MEAKNNIDPEIRSLLSKFLRDNIMDEDELNKLNSWYNNIYSAPKLDVARNLKHKENVFRNIKSKIRSEQRQVFFNLKWAAAVSFLAFLAVIVILNTLKQTYSEPSEEVRWTVFKTGRGERTSIFLPDSSKVFLSANSSIRFPLNFNKNRKVELKGLAFFKVKKIENSSFEVITDKLRTTVLGTSFSVGAPRQGEERVEVRTGKVKVKQHVSTKHTILSKGQRVYTFRDNLVPSIISEEEDAFLWIDNTLVFNNVTVTEMAEKLEDWYGVKVKILDSGSTCRITGKYQDIKLEEVLKIINYSISIQYKWENGNLIIEKVSCE